MTSDQVLTGLALLDVVRKAGPDTLGDFLNITGTDCEHVGAAVYLAGLVIAVAEAGGVDIDALINEHRQKAIAMEPPGGMA